MVDIEIKQEILPVIQINFDEVKAALSTTMKKYQGIIVTEDTLSLCKLDQKELAGIRIKIDNYRKEKKNEMSKPIAAFEDQCKELIKLVEQAEKPIKEGISVFDNMKKAEKKVAAEKIIDDVATDLELRPKFRAKFAVIDKYMNLTATEKAVREDVEQRGVFFKAEQDREDAEIQVIRSTIDNANKGNIAKIEYGEFEDLLDMNYPVPQIITRINNMGEKIRLAENPPVKAQEPQIRAEVPQVTTSSTAPENLAETVLVESEPIYFITFKMYGNRFQTKAMGDYLRANNIKYDVIEKGEV